MNTKSGFVDVLMSLDKLTNNKEKTISKQEYQEFCKTFVFEKIKGETFGEAFCKKFDFNDTFLKNLTDETAKYHIERLGYIKE